MRKGNKLGISDVVLILLLASIGVLGAITIGAWQAGIFDRTSSELDTQLARNKGSMTAPNDCPDTRTAAVVQGGWANQGSPRHLFHKGKRLQISADLDEKYWEMDFNSDGDTDDLIPRLPSPVNNRDDWIAADGGIVVASKGGGPSTDNWGSNSIFLSTSEDVTLNGAASTIINKIRYKNPLHTVNGVQHEETVRFFWPVRTVDEMSTLAPRSSDPTKNFLPPRLPAIPLPSRNTGNVILRSVSFNMRIAVNKEKGCWTLQTIIPGEYFCDGGGNTCLFGHDYTYLVENINGNWAISFFYPPTPSIVAGGSAVVLDASNYASEDSETITCGAITAELNSGLTVTKPGTCSYSITAGAAAEGTKFVDIHFSSSSGAERTMKLPVNISNIDFEKPDPPVIPPGGNTTINAREAASDGVFTLNCANATSVSSELTVTRNDCTYTVTATSSATQGIKNFSVVYTSTGGDTHNGTFDVKVGGLSDIQFVQPARIIVPPSGTITVNVSSAATDGDYTVSCGSPTNVTHLTSATGSDCSITLTAPTSRGNGSFQILYTSTGGDTHNATFLIGVAEIDIPRTLSQNIVYGTATPFNVNTGISDGSSTISCSNITVDSSITKTGTGCNTILTPSSTTPRSTTMSVTYNSTSNAPAKTATWTIKLSKIETTTPATIQIARGQSTTINALTQASDTGFTVSCSNHRRHNTFIASATEGTECNYNVTAGTTSGSGWLYVYYRSTGGHRTTLTFNIQVVDILFRAPARITVPTDGTSITIPAGSYASDGVNVISCSNGEVQGVGFGYTLTANGCNYTLSVDSRFPGGNGNLQVQYSSSGGGRLTANIPIFVARIVRASRTFMIPTGVARRLNPQPAERGYTVSCGDGSVASGTLTLGTRTGCVFEVTAGNIGESSFTFPLRSTSGTAATGTINLLVTASTVTSDTLKEVSAGNVTSATATVTGNNRGNCVTSLQVFVTWSTSTRTQFRIVANLLPTCSSYPINNLRFRLDTNTGRTYNRSMNIADPNP